MTNPNSPPTQRRAALAFILVTVLLDILALGVIIPVLPKLIEGFLGGDVEKAAGVYGLFGTVWALMQFLFSPLLGALSDRFGRRPIVLLSNFGLGLDYILMALAPTLGWMFAGRVVSGITAASIPTAFAYIADVTPTERRARAFGMVGAAFGLGFVLGPALGGLLGGIHPRLPFWVSAGLSLTNAFYGLLVLPESLPREQRARFAWKKANPVGSVALLRSHPELLGLAGVNFLNALAHEVLPSVFVLYADYRYGWGPGMVGATLALVGVCAAAVQGGLVQPIVGWLGERASLLVALFSGAAGFATYGAASTGAIFLLGIPVMALWGVTGPAVQGLMTRHVAPSEQGRLQGANGCLRGISGMIGPILFTMTFKGFIGAWKVWHLPGAPFLLASALLLAALVLAWRVTRSRPG